MPHAAQSQTMIPQEKGKLGRHITHLAPSVIFANVFNHKQVWIVFLIFALNDLDIEAANIRNAHLNVPPGEKDCAECEPEFYGRCAIIARTVC